MCIKGRNIMRLMQIINISILGLALTTAGAHAELVKSGSKFRVVVEKYEGTSTCKPDEGGLSSRVSSTLKTFSSATGSDKEKLLATLKEGVHNAMSGSGCKELTSKPVEVLQSEGSEINVPIGTLIAAYKD